jgi:hypothetical protein
MAARVSPAVARRERGALWLDDLGWHKHMFRRSRFQWAGWHVMDVVTRTTGGQLDFFTVAHLRRLQQYQDEVRDYGTQCQIAMAAPLRQAYETLGWEPTAEALGLTVVDCTSTLTFAAGTTEEERTNGDVRRVLHRLPFSNPLIQAWELKQLWRLHEAARNVFEDVICDLLLELLPSHSADGLAEATGPLVMKPAGRAELARLERGGPGDPRRAPQQIF